MPDDLKHYGRRKHDLQGMLLGMIGAMGLMILLYYAGVDEQKTALPCKRCHSPEEIQFHNAKEYRNFHQQKVAHK